MDEMDFTRKFRLGDQRDLEIKAILASVYQALQEKGYNPVNQIVGYILSEDPTYITNHNNARALIRKVDRDELLQTLVACLLGIPCRYDGAGKADPAIEKLRQGGHTLIPVCPEILGGLPTPRPPAERLPDGRVVTREGKDVTAEYRSGAEQALALARKQGCVLAVLKERSPS